MLSRMGRNGYEKAVLQAKKLPRARYALVYFTELKPSRPKYYTALNRNGNVGRFCLHACKQCEARAKQTASRARSEDPWILTRA